MQPTSVVSTGEEEALVALVALESGGQCLLGNDNKRRENLSNREVIHGIATQVKARRVVVQPTWSGQETNHHNNLPPPPNSTRPVRSVPQLSSRHCESRAASSVAPRQNRNSAALDDDTTAATSLQTFLSFTWSLFVASFFSPWPLDDARCLTEANFVRHHYDSFAPAVSAMIRCATMLLVSIIIFFFPAVVAAEETNYYVGITSLLVAAAHIPVVVYLSYGLWKRRSHSEKKTAAPHTADGCTVGAAPPSCPPHLNSNSLSDPCCTESAPSDTTDGASAVDIVGGNTDEPLWVLPSRIHMSVGECLLMWSTSAMFAFFFALVPGKAAPYCDSPFDKTLCARTVRADGAIVIVYLASVSAYRLRAIIAVPLFVFWTVSYLIYFQLSPILGDALKDVTVVIIVVVCGVSITASLSTDLASRRHFESKMKLAAEQRSASALKQFYSSIAGSMIPEHVSLVMARGEVVRIAMKHAMVCCIGLQESPSILITRLGPGGFVCASQQCALMVDSAVRCVNATHRSSPRAPGPVYKAHSLGDIIELFIDLRDDEGTNRSSCVTGPMARGTTIASDAWHMSLLRTLIDDISKRLQNERGRSLGGRNRRHSILPPVVKWVDHESDGNADENNNSIAHVNRPLGAASDVGDAETPSLRLVSAVSVGPAVATNVAHTNNFVCTGPTVVLVRGLLTNHRSTAGPIEMPPEPPVLTVLVTSEMRSFAVQGGRDGAESSALVHVEVLETPLPTTTRGVAHASSCSHALSSQTDASANSMIVIRYPPAIEAPEDTHTHRALPQRVAYGKSAAPRATSAHRLIPPPAVEEAVHTPSFSTVVNPLTCTTRDALSSSAHRRPGVVTTESQQSAASVDAAQPESNPLLQLEPLIHRWLPLTRFVSEEVEEEFCLWVRRVGALGNTLVSFTSQFFVAVGFALCFVVSNDTRSNAVLICAFASFAALCGVAVVVLSGDRIDDDTAEQHSDANPDGSVPQHSQLLVSNTSALVPRAAASHRATPLLSLLRSAANDDHSTSFDQTHRVRGPSSSSEVPTHVQERVAPPPRTSSAAMSNPLSLGHLVIALDVAYFALIALAYANTDDLSPIASGQVWAVTMMLIAALRERSERILRTVLLDTVVSILFIAVAVLTGGPLRNRETFYVIVVIGAWIGIVSFRCAGDVARRNRFVLDAELHVLEAQVSRDGHQLAALLRQLVPQASTTKGRLFAQLLDAIRGDELRDGGAGRIPWVKTAGPTAGARSVTRETLLRTPRLFGIRGSLFATRVEDRPLLLVRFDANRRFDECRGLGDITQSLCVLDEWMGILGVALRSVPEATLVKTDGDTVMITDEKHDTQGERCVSLLSVVAELHRYGQQRLVKPRQPNDAAAGSWSCSEEGSRVCNNSDRESPTEAPVARCVLVAGPVMSGVLGTAALSYEYYGEAVEVGRRLLGPGGDIVWTRLGGGSGTEGTASSVTVRATASTRFTDWLQWKLADEACGAASFLSSVDVERCAPHRFQRMVRLSDAMTSASFTITIRDVPIELGPPSKLCLGMEHTTTSSDALQPLQASSRTTRGDFFRTLRFMKSDPSPW